MSFQTLQSLIDHLPAHRQRQALGLRGDFGVRWWTYWQLYTATLRDAALLRDLQLVPGESVLLWAPNCPEWVSFFFGAALRGVVVVPLDENASQAYVQRIITEVDAKLVVHGPEQDVRGFTIPALALLREPSVSEPLSFADLATSVDTDAPAVRIFTSGTTRQPRGVVLTHANIASQIRQFQRWRWLARLFPCRVLVLAPLSHTQGLLLGVAVPLSLGLSVLYTHAFDPAHLMRTIHDNRVTVLATVPRVLHVLARGIGRVSSRRLVQGPHVHRILGMQFRVLLVGGASLPESDERFWRDSGCVLVQGYGLTETAAIVSVNQPLKGPLGSIGKPLSHHTVRLAEDGELLVRGPNVSPAEVSADGFLHTGDLMRRDARDRLYFVGRKKDVIITGEGHNVYPHDVEAVVNEIPGVMDAVVLGLEADGHAEVHAALLLEGGAEAPRIVRQANAALEPHQTIRSWSVWPEADFPRTVLLKVKREAVAAAIRGNTRSNEHQVAERPRRLQQLATDITAGCSDGRVDERSRLVEDLGLGSLDIAELVTLVERAKHVTLDAMALPRNATLGDLRALVDTAGAHDRTAARRHRAPRWQENPPARLVRAVTTAAVVPLWFSSRARLTVRGADRLADLQPPFILAGANHHHAMDVMAIHSALPRRLRKNLMVVSSSFAFREYFEPPPGTSVRQRLLVAAGFHFGMSLFFPFTIVAPHTTTRQDLWDLGRMVDRGYNPLIFPQGWPDPSGVKPILPGVARLALETHLPLVPLILQGNETIGFRPRRLKNPVTVRFGSPIPVSPSANADWITRRLSEAFDALEAKCADPAQTHAPS